MNDNDFLLALREYIEQVAVQIDDEWGMLRTLDELVAEDAMPPIYAEVIRRISVA